MESERSSRVCIINIQRYNWFFFFFFKGSSSLPHHFNYLDMTSEREALVTNTFPRLKASCAERNILFGSVDLRWGITAEETLGGRALATCLYEIDQCRPYFIGLLGERYGWVAGSSKDDVFEKNIKLAANIYPWVEYEIVSIRFIVAILFALLHGLYLIWCFFFFFFFF